MNQAMEDKTSTTMAKPTLKLFQALVLLTAIGISVCASFELGRVLGSPPPSFESGKVSESQSVPFAIPNTILADIDDTGYLTLVNKDYPVPWEPEPESLVSAWPTVPVSNAQEIRLRQPALDAVEALFAAARAASAGSFYVSSGYRSYGAQSLIYHAAEDRSFVQPPGHSEHHLGLAVDIMAVGIGQQDLGDTPEGRWLAENAHRFGLVLRYPKGKERQTGIAHEPWHFRYVGAVHAAYMHRQGLVLEEYVELLQRKGELTIALDGRTYRVQCQVPANGMLHVPDDAKYEISGDNAGRFVVTSW